MFVFSTQYAIGTFPGTQYKQLSWFDSHEGMKANESPEVPGKFIRIND